MKLVHATNNPAERSLVEFALKSAGIEYSVRNDTIAGLTGGIPVTECTPEYWVAPGSEFERARSIIKDLRKSSTELNRPWTCPECREDLEPQFESCWNCGSGRPIFEG